MRKAEVSGQRSEVSSQWTVERGLRTAVIVFFLIAAFVVSVRIGLGQQQPAGSRESGAGGRSEAIKLNPEASKQYLAIENQQREVVRQANEALQSLEREKQALLIGANISRADLAKVECAADAGGAVTCSRKSESGAGSQESGKEKPNAEGSGQKAENKKPPEKQ